MTSTTYGREIAIINCQKPQWFDPCEDSKRVYISGTIVEGPVGPNARIGWPRMKSIALPVDHWVYKALDAGFEPWRVQPNESKPDDIDPSAKILTMSLISGDLDRKSDNTSARWRPSSHEQGWHRVIGYKKKKPNPDLKHVPGVGMVDAGGIVWAPEPRPSVEVPMLTEAEARKLWHYSSLSDEFVDHLRDLGLIIELKPKTPLETFLEAHPEACADTATKLMEFPNNGDVQNHG